MPTKQITLSNTRLAPHKAIVHPNFRSKTVLVEDTWEYVKMWLNREGKKNALLFWEQAGQFHQASAQLPNMSAPLTEYYCFLNAVKALLSVRGIGVSPQHGVTGESTSQRAHLSP